MRIIIVSYGRGRAQGRRRGLFKFIQCEIKMGAYLASIRVHAAFTSLSEIDLTFVFGFRISFSVSRSTVSVAVSPMRSTHASNELRSEPISSGGGCP